MKTSKKRKNVESLVFGIIGDPINHSLSPAMHNAALQKLGLAQAYLPFRIRPQGLKAFLKNTPVRGLTGFNVTIPHKEAIIPFLASLTREAKLIGAVNTVRRRKGRWEGDNTDGRGYLASLSADTGFSPRGKRIVILGAGGAARAVTYALAKKRPKSIVIMNRTEERARTLAQEFSGKFRTHFTALPLEKEACCWVFPDADLVVNTTSIGMKGTRFDELDLKALPKTAIVSDLVYRPLKTPLLKQAERLKLKTHTGLGMLLHQGALAFEWLTGRRAPLAVMKKALLDALKADA